MFGVWRLFTWYLDLGRLAARRLKGRCEMRRQIVAMGVACLVASTVGSALAQAFYPIDFSSQANYSWVRKAYYATTGPRSLCTDWGLTLVASRST